MSNDHSSIHDFDVNLICEYFSSLERQGPGSPEVTRKALGFIDSLHAESRIADIGCGTGGQTMVLAKHAPGRITGVDLFPLFIDLFNRNAANHHLSDRVSGIVGNMESLPFQHGELDLIWAEGSIYNMGFRKGISAWRGFLKPGGYLAVTEASWFTTGRPEPIESFWKDAYPEIDTIPVKVTQMQEAGYVPVATFILPENCWTDHFYTLQAAMQDTFLEKHPGNITAAQLVANERREAALYQQYKAFYGYVFYIGMKTT